ncbi:hypothetical protein [Cellulomonas fengjieae]|uniref:Uncharacterized protein n=1 Tax=Cellulomonas fengjieae TaxID=2819978 RepID=A0ABS3SEH2_9CELL|nr:hypothetical protein [Cellulomonas fengjieae]MBO3084144.1 hypothetical protein [Cellulomonas fengjieae]MBO3103636.1 hypothetical protein [Cellulomonas fengjieae]QVI64603.1 hypothetical protein KG102_10430 [Cellulomonas fengjieae]
MSMWISVLLAVAFVSLLAALLWAVRRDGLGHRQPPASHYDWFEVPR